MDYSKQVEAQAAAKNALRHELLQSLFCYFCFRSFSRAQYDLEDAERELCTAVAV
jgi:hypothetical protein